MQLHIQIVVSEQEAIQLRPNRPLGLAVVSCLARHRVFQYLIKIHTRMRTSPSPFSSQFPHCPREECTECAGDNGKDPYYEVYFRVC
jgi:hypothetical protein